MPESHPEKENPVELAEKHRRTACQLINLHPISYKAGMLEAVMSQFANPELFAIGYQAGGMNNMPQRGVNTAEFMRLMFCHGPLSTESGVQEALQKVRDLHKSIGIMETDSGHVKPKYEDLFIYVLSTLALKPLYAIERTGRALSEENKEDVYQFMIDIGRALGLRNIPARKEAEAAMKEREDNLSKNDTRSSQIQEAQHAMGKAVVDSFVKRVTAEYQKHLWRPVGGSTLITRIVDRTIRTAFQAVLDPTTLKYLDLPNPKVSKFLLRAALKIGDPIHFFRRIRGETD